MKLMLQCSSHFIKYMACTHLCHELTASRPHGLLLVCSSNMNSLCCIQQPIAQSKTMPRPPSTGPRITHILSSFGGSLLNGAMVGAKLSVVVVVIVDSLLCPEVLSNVIVRHNAKR